MTIKNIIFIKKYLIENKLKLTITIMLLLVSSLIALPTPALSGIVIDKVLILRDLSELNKYVLILILIFLLSNIISFLQDYAFMRLKQEFTFTLQRDLLKKIFFLPKSYFDNIQSGYLNARINEIGLLSNYFSYSALMLLGDVFKFTGAIVLCFTYSLKLSLISIAFLPLAYYVIKKNSKRIRANSYEIAELSAKLDANIIERISSIELIKSFGKECYETDHLENKIRKKIKTEIKQSLLSSVSGKLITVVFGLNSFLLLWVSGVEIVAGRLTVGEYIAFVAYMGYLTAPLQNFAYSILQFQNVYVASTRVNELYNMVDEKNSLLRNIRFEKFSYGIQFENICFKYNSINENENRNNFVLNNVSFFIGVNEKVLLKGISGSGKTTIISLLLGFYEPNIGCIRYDNIDLKNIVLQSLREKIGLISQNIILFDDSIMNNIKYSNPEASDLQVIAAAKAADANDFIMSFKDGYDTKIGETGKRLSGGQKQKISIARVILKNPDIVILDEPDSHLDEKSLKNLNNTFIDIFSNKTCIVISHNQNIPWINKVFVLENGMVNQQNVLSTTETYKIEL